ncbi:MAG: hypothetical protein AAFR52_19750, partial [Pseudomonadota bacterium]
MKDDLPQPAEPAHRVALQPDPDDALLTRIREISQNARTTWFGLLALLAFIGVTLMAHEDAHFFAHGVETELPLIGLSVPTRAFFIAAPLLLAAVYAYFHLYLLALWDRLATADSTIEGAPLAERSYPWLLSQTALWLRTMRRGDGSAPRRAMGPITAILTFGISWALAPGLLALLWIESWPYHAAWLSLIAAGALFAALWVGVTTAWVFWLLMGPRGERSAECHRTRWPLVATGLAVALTLTAFTLGRTGYDGWHTLPLAWKRNPETGRIVEQVVDGRIRLMAENPLPDLIPPAPANLREAELTIRPADWTSHALWLEDFEERYRKREGLPLAGSLSGDQQIEFDQEAWERYANRTRALQSPNLQA